ncbi:hypothetical protein [Nocardia carnea]|uniref:hypothetical protein n=1 Tax=Nocardia carnea TaxID=37328 RepID=UPI002453859B|nr:hypothetical protein [Nocardia carnea]
MDDYADDYPAIDTEMSRGADLAFGPFLGWTAYTLPAFQRELAGKYPAPDLAYLHFRRHADAALEKSAAAAENSDNEESTGADSR